MFRHFPCISAANVLVARYFPEICPQILEHKGHAHEVQRAEQHPATNAFFPMLLRGVTYFARSARCASVSVKLTWSLAALYLGTCNPIASNSSIKQRIFFHHFSSAFSWSDCQPQCA